mmetsp:Transcript_16576/g.42794  ORF Transcript_16576/g.42794 Transcript_16576/m.42794 type:complete len:234 (+) Transcript_16576:796-1497(+)
MNTSEPIPWECDRTRMASIASGSTMASEGAPSGASCCKCGSRSSVAAPRQKTAFSSTKDVTSSVASVRIMRRSALDCAAPECTAATSSRPLRKASVLAVSKVPWKGRGTGIVGSGCSSAAATMPSEPSAQRQSASWPSTNSTQHRRPSASRTAKPPSANAMPPPLPPLGGAAAKLPPLVPPVGEPFGASRARASSKSSWSSDFSRQVEKSTPCAVNCSFSCRTERPIAADKGM